MEFTVEQHRARLKSFGEPGERLAYLDEGKRDGRVVVLVHGMPTSSWLYRNIVPGLVEAGFRVVAPDLLGFGASDKPRNQASYGFDRQAERLVRLMAHLGIAKWTQVVHDLGGPWTWELADKHPQLLEGLIILNTTAYRQGFAPPAMMKVVGGPLGRLVAALIRSRITGPSQIKALFGQLMNTPETLTQETLRGYWLPLHEGGTEAFLSFARAFPWWFQQFDRYQKALRRLNIPAATIWGGSDAVLDVNLLPDQFARDLKIPEGRRQVVDAGHFLQEDQPHELTRLIVDFMMSSASEGA